MFIMCLKEKETIKGIDRHAVNTRLIPQPSVGGWEEALGRPIDQQDV